MFDSWIVRKENAGSRILNLLEMFIIVADEIKILVVSGGWSHECV